MSQIKTIIFDLGGVLIDWNPKYLYLKEFNGNHEKMHWFLENICTFEWNENQDAGYGLELATQDLIVKFPEHQSHIEMYYGRWEEMLGGSIPESVAILKRLVEKQQYKIVSLTNWSHETFPIAQERFEFLTWFEDIIVSGQEKTRKPFDEIYYIALNRFDTSPEQTLFIDDNLRNIEAAHKLGIQTIHFLDSEDLENELKKRGLIT